MGIFYIIYFHYLQRFQYLLKLQYLLIFSNTMKDLLEDYCLQHTDDEPDYLKEINRETHLKQLKPRMLSGHYQGRILSFISHLLKPKNILEIGTYTGYSTLCLAEGMQSDGQLTTIEVNEELEETILKNIQKADKNYDIKLIIGNALDIIPRINSNFDLVFIDADKNNYLNYYKLIVEKLNPGGVIISDNVLWSSKVLDQNAQDKTTQLLREYNNFLKEDKRMKKVLLPVRDGLYLSMKI